MRWRDGVALQRYDYPSQRQGRPPRPRDPSRRRVLAGPLGERPGRGRDNIPTAQTRATDPVWLGARLAALPRGEG